MIPFYSRRNQVYPVLWQGRAAVEKHFCDPSDWQRETALYFALSDKLPLPKVLFSGDGKLVTEYCPWPTLLDELERQEKAGFLPAPWLALAAWLAQCLALSGYLPSEGNLRNFLWDRETNRVVGLDLEGFYSPAAISDFGGTLIATLLEYTPADTAVKRKAAALLAAALAVPDEAVSGARQALRLRRAGKSRMELSGIILAGGLSKRMGQPKAALPLLGKPLLLWQVEKLQAMGIRDILISGKSCPALPGTTVVPDEYPHRGPLGGLHACLRRAKTPCCMVLSVDTPLIPLSTLIQMARAHVGGVTVLRHAGGEEPLIGVYDRELWEQIPQLIAAGGAPVRSLARFTNWSCFAYRGPEAFLHNCNTPEDFARIQTTIRTYAAQGLCFGGASTV